MLSLFTGFITEFESSWAITVYLNDYLLKVKGRLINNIHFTFGEIFLNSYIHYYMLIYLVIYTVEQGRNRDRRDACDLWFFSQFLGMIFSAVNFYANKNCCCGHQEHLNGFFNICCFLLSCTSYLIGRMLRYDHTTFQKIEVKRLENEMSGIINPSFNGLTHIWYVWTLLLSIFRLDKFFFKKFLQAYHWLLKFGNSPLYAVWKLKKVELSKMIVKRHK